jgi:hypothetical protein
LENIMSLKHKGLPKKQESFPTWRLVFGSRKSFIFDGGQRRDRTADAGLFRAALYH